LVDEENIDERKESENKRLFNNFVSKKLKENKFMYLFNNININKRKLDVIKIN